MRDTVLMYMTDNGYSLGEHRWTGKVCGYDPCTKSPLLIKYRGDHSGRIFHEIVGNEDLAPTIADLAEAESPGNPDGESFAQALRSGYFPDEWEDAALLRGFRRNPRIGETRSYWGVRTHDFKYIQTLDTGEEELYDLVNDPLELESVASDPAYAQILAAHRSKMEEMRLR
jgi:arylsulfatase A-like enzyme